ncbi:unnamed protein product [Pieris brassicae]|uniref:Uncharacterized protein n=1 Tax=Pieris brassicae TaxID=7116 RepID=A0A9P0TTL1_PIEBR|nr:unnamed protein product [Pieris brassicae]
MTLLRSDVTNHFIVTGRIEDNSCCKISRNSSLETNCCSSDSCEEQGDSLYGFASWRIEDNSCCKISRNSSSETNCCSSDSCEEQGGSLHGFASCEVAPWENDALPT